MRDIVRPETEKLGELLEIPYNNYLKIPQPFEKRVTRSSKKNNDSILQGTKILENNNKKDEQVLEEEEEKNEVQEKLPLIIEEVETKEKEIISEDIPPLVEEPDNKSVIDDTSSNNDFSITDSDEGEKSAAKLEGMGGNLELEQWTNEAILEHLGPVVDRAKTVWKFLNGKEKSPPLNYVIPCGAIEYLPEAYELALGRMIKYLDTLVEESLVNSMNTVMLTIKNDEPKWEKALLGDEAEAWQMKRRLLQYQKINLLEY